MSPVVAAVLRGLCRGLDDDRRRDLWRLAIDAVGTAGDGEAEIARWAWGRHFIAVTQSRWRPALRRRRHATFEESLEAAAFRAARAVRRHDDQHAHRELLARVDELLGDTTTGLPDGLVALCTREDS